MASKFPHTVLLKGNPQMREHLFMGPNVGLTPGMLVGIRNRVDATELDQRIFNVTQDNLTAADGVLVVRERDIFPHGSIDEEIPIGDTVIVASMRKGDEFYGFISPSVNVTVGDGLVHDTNGCMKKAAEGDVIIARAMQVVNNTGSNKARIKAEVV